MCLGCRSPIPSPPPASPLNACVPECHPPVTLLCCAHQQARWRTRLSTASTGPPTATTLYCRASRRSTASWSSSTLMSLRSWQQLSTSWPQTWSGTRQVCVWGGGVSVILRLAGGGGALLTEQRLHCVPRKHTQHAVGCVRACAQGVLTGCVPVPVLPSPHLSLLQPNKPQAATSPLL